MEIKTPLAHEAKQLRHKHSSQLWWAGRRRHQSIVSAHLINSSIFFLFKSAFGGVGSHKTLFSIHYQISISHLCSASPLHPQVTLQYLWEKEYQVLVFYHHPMALEVPFLWPGQMMPSPWANTTDPEKLIQFLQASVTDRRSVLLLLPPTASWSWPLILIRDNSHRLNETECVCLSCNRPWGCFRVIISASLLFIHSSTNGPKSNRDGTLLRNLKSLL